MFYVINYEAVAAELPSLRALLRSKRMALVLDESHRTKSPTAKVTQAIQSLRRNASRRYIMTGTPVANKPEDLWAQYFFLDGTVTLPPKTFRRVAVQLVGEQCRMYDEMRNSLALWVQDLSGADVLAQGDNILPRLVRLAQLASNPRLIDSRYAETPAKFKVLDELLSVCLNEPTEKLIIWTSFVDNIRRLKERLSSYRPVTLYGEMDGKSRADAVSFFKKDPQVRILVANPAAAREGLTLTEARTVYLDRTFNLVDFLQSQDRIHRLSQVKPCEIVLLMAENSMMAENSIDEFVDFSLSQRDSDEIDSADLALQKPDLLRALLEPVSRASE